MRFGEVDMLEFANGTASYYQDAAIISGSGFSCDEGAVHWIEEYFHDCVYR